jgi:hypothetical protein
MLDIVIGGRKVAHQAAAVRTLTTGGFHGHDPWIGLDIP